MQIMINETWYELEDFLTEICERLMFVESCVVNVNDVLSDIEVSGDGELYDGLCVYPAIENESSYYE